MLILCYGITRSGSTLAFELVKGMLASAGHTQDQLPVGVVQPGKKINFIARIDRISLGKAMAAVPDHRMIAIKTHSAIDRETFEYLQTLQAARKVQAIATYRDPRDVCLSLIDANEKAQALGRESWAAITGMDSAIKNVARQLGTFRNWASIKGTLRLDYDVLAFAPDQAIDAIERTLGITSGREAVKAHAFENAFTQKNKGVPARHKTELSPEQSNVMLERFGEFIERVCVNRDDGWFSGYADNRARHRQRALAL